MIYICPICKYKQREQIPVVIFCDDCSIVMIDERVMDIAGKKKAKITKKEDTEARINIAKAMEKRFPGLKWTKRYLSIREKIKKITPAMIEKYE